MKLNRNGLAMPISWLCLSVPCLTGWITTTAGVAHALGLPAPPTWLAISIARDSSGLLQAGGFDVSTGHFTPLADGYSIPSWSADRTTMYFNSQATSQTDPAAASVGSDGTGLRQLTLPGNPIVSGVKPSPDGTRLEFQGNYGPVSGTWVVNTDGSSPVNLGKYSYANWSPDGTKLVVADGTDPSCTATIAVVSAASGQVLSRLTPCSGPLLSRPDWSPDGASVVYQSGGSIVVRQVTGGASATVLVATSQYQFSSPTWSPDGRYVAAFRQDNLAPDSSAEQMQIVIADSQSGALWKVWSLPAPWIYGLSEMEWTGAPQPTAVPSGAIVGPIQASEGTPYSLTLGAVSDLGPDTMSSYIVHWGDGTTNSYTTNGAKTHTYSNGPLVATVTVDLITSAGTFVNRGSPLVVTVDNVPPSVGTVVMSASLVPVSTAVTATVQFIDLGSRDTHTAVWDWGDFTTSAGAVTEAAGSGTATAIHSFTTPGVYPVLVNISDNDGGVSTQAAYRYVVVYDPTAGYETGSGQFISKPGCLIGAPAVTGKGEFGFNTKYTKAGQLVSESEFELEAGKFHFHSDNAAWLVVNGATGQFQGTGTVEDSSHTFGYVITVTDGQVTGGGGIDKIRVQVWDNTNAGSVVYDSEPASPRYAAATTAISKGEIKFKK